MSRITGILLAFVILLAVSALLASFGLLQNSSAVVIGAMVIAPLLGPNMALALGTSLGDTKLMGQAFKSLLGGLALAIAIALLIALLWPVAMVISLAAAARSAALTVRCSPLARCFTVQASSLRSRSPRSAAKRAPARSASRRPLPGARRW